MYVLINEDGHNGVRVVRRGSNVVQHLNEALVRGYLVRSKQQRFPTRIRYSISHDVKRCPDASVLALVCPQAGRDLGSWLREGV